VGWNVMNDGTEAWDVDSVEFTYLGGAKLYDYPVVKLQASVAPGQEIVLSAHMRAPRYYTMYTTYWSLRQGNTFFCRLKLSIYVK
jgi:Ig-like domain from next to BRCA1 gene